MTMNEKLDKALVEDFPLLYRNRYGDMRMTCMCWGFECGDGWEPIIREASEKLEHLIEKFIEDNPDSDYRPCASQVKEKYGTLRFYMHFETDEMSRVIEEVESLSETTCEQCGATNAKLRGERWYYTACDECEERKK